MYVLALLIHPPENNEQGQRSGDSKKSYIRSGTEGRNGPGIGPNQARGVPCCARGIYH